MPRPPAVAGTFYPADSRELRRLVAELLAEAERRAPGIGAEPQPPAPPVRRPPLGLLVPHAGLAYSGLVAAAAWRRLAGGEGTTPMTVILLGTNHGAAWLDGIGVWDGGPWRVPDAEIAVDDELVAAILGLGPPFGADRRAHSGEHSIEVQLPFLVAVAPGARIAALAVASGTGPDAIEAGERLGRLVAARPTDRPVAIVVSTDMAHYPDRRTCSGVTEALVPAIRDLDPGRLAELERTIVQRGPSSGLVCGMCGIQPAVLGLAALRAAGAGPGAALAAATSAEAGGPVDRTVGYLAVEFAAPVESRAPIDLPGVRETGAGAGPSPAGQ
jgi:AmmeMemoRadiSam system protein B